MCYWLRSCSRPVRRYLFQVLTVRILKYSVMFAFLVIVLTPIVAPSYSRLPAHYRRLRWHCQKGNLAPACANPGHDKIFISTILFDRDGELANGRWGDKVVKLINIRDATYQLIFPFFQALGQGASRADVLAQKDAVRVKSCWGGMMAVQAKDIQNTTPELPGPHFRTLSGHVIDPENPPNATAPFRFRHELDIYYDACECCLFSADLSQVARNDGAEDTGIYINPFIRVGYTEGVLAGCPSSNGGSASL
jgi:hypothetical protein